MNSKNKKAFHLGDKTKTVLVNIALCLFAAFDICFAVPLDLFLNNTADIAFPIKPLICFMAALSAVVFAVLFAGCMLIRGKANDIYRSLIFGISLALYVQSALLSLYMSILDGKRYEVGFGKAALNILIWAALIAVPFVLRRKFPESFNATLVFVSLGIIVTQIISLNVSYNKCQKSWSDEQAELVLYGKTKPVCTAKDIEVYGKNKNLIVVLADAYDSFVFDETMEKAPDSLSEFDGFTYYSNTVGRYCATTCATAYITTGVPFETTVDAQYDNLEFYDTVSKNFKTNIYSALTAPPAEISMKYASNVAYKEVDSDNFMLYIKSLYKLTFFRTMPEVMKPLFLEDTAYFGKDLRSGTLEYDYDMLNFYNRMPRELTVNDEDTFKFIYLYGLHPARNVTSDLKRSKQEVEPFEQAVAVNKIIGEYFKILKDNGVYDNSDILVLADHGLDESYGKKYPLLMFKPAHQTETGIKVSDAPISHSDLYPTLLKLASGQPEERTIFDIGEDEQRTRLFSSTYINEIGLNVQDTDSIEITAQNIKEDP